MYGERRDILVNTLKRLIHRNANNRLRNLVHRTHPADLGRSFAWLPDSGRQRIFNLLDNTEIQAELITELDEKTFEEFSKDLSDARLAQIFVHISEDDTVALLEQLPEEKSTAVLNLMHRADSEKVEELLQFNRQTAGSIMVTDFVAFPENRTSGAAIRNLQQEIASAEMPFYLYIIDSEGGLKGVCSLRQLVTVPPDTPLREIMTDMVISVHTDTDQEEVARMAARYNLLAIPVVDDTGKLVGLVTIDDIVDVIQDEATEDILKMVGAGKDYVETRSIWSSSKIRFPWLSAAGLGGIIAFFIIGRFEKTLSEVVYLAAFIPVVMGMGGNVGTQSATIVVRGLATGALTTHHLWKTVLKEMAVGGMLGCIYGLLLGAVAHFRYQIWKLGIVVGGSVVFSMTVAAIVGALLPMVFARLNVDPAVATGPFVTTTLDIVSILAYFAIANYLLIG